VYADYYQCLSPAQTGRASQCYSPSSTWLNHERNTHDSQELRLSTPDDWRVRSIAGIFWESYEIQETTNWSYKTAPGFTDIGPPPGSGASDMSIRGDNIAFLDDITRGYQQKAAFASIDYDIIPKTLTVTAGTRYYDIDTNAHGYSVGSFGCYADGPPPCTGNLPYANNLTALHLDQVYVGFRSRANEKMHALHEKKARLPRRLETVYRLPRRRCSFAMIALFAAQREENQWRTRA
jgi:hypothetical protein